MVDLQLLRDKYLKDIKMEVIDKLRFELLSSNINFKNTGRLWASGRKKNKNL